MRRLLLVVMILFLFPGISFAGWENDELGMRYKMDDGTYKTGWHQDVDGKWYYLDDSAGYVLKNTTTPDGYTVNESGVWIDGESGMKKTSQYDHNVSYDVTAYKAYSSKELKKFETVIPVTVHYNDKYEYISWSDKKLKVEIESLEISNEGVLYVTYYSNEENYYHEIHVTTRYAFENGTYKDVESEFGTWGGKIESEPVMNYHKKKGDLNPISAEVYIYVKDVE